MGEEEQNLIRLLCLPLKELAEELGVTYTAARNYSVGRPMPSEVGARLAMFAREHAARLETLAAQLRKAGEE